MYSKCQEELIKTLVAAGARSPFTSSKKLSLSSESRLSAVLCEAEVLERAKANRFYGKEDKRYQRQKIYARDITFSIVIGDYTYDKAEETYISFLQLLPDGISVDGNYVSIEPGDVQWMGEKDHILYSKVALQLKVTCHGGLYKDIETTRLTDVSVEVGKDV